MIAQSNENTAPQVRCAIYTRSAVRGVFDQRCGIETQRMAGENVVASHASEGWIVLPERYDDDGYSANYIGRPGLKRLLEDVQSGKVDCVVIYSFDRLFRSMFTMTQILITLMAHNVFLASVTQSALERKHAQSQALAGARR